MTSDCPLSSTKTVFTRGAISDSHNKHGNERIIFCCGWKLPNGRPTGINIILHLLKSPGKNATSDRFPLRPTGDNETCSETQMAAMYPGQCQKTISSGPSGVDFERCPHAVSGRLAMVPPRFSLLSRRRLNTNSGM